MPSPTVKTTFGSTFGYESATPGTYEILGAVTDIKFSGVTCGTKETTAHDTTTGKTYIGLTKDYGEVSLTLEFDADDTKHAALTGFVGVLKKFQLAPAGSVKKWTASGITTKVGGWSYPLDGVHSCEVTIKISGDATLA